MDGTGASILNRQGERVSDQIECALLQLMIEAEIVQLGMNCTRTLNLLSNQHPLACPMV